MNKLIKMGDGWILPLETNEVVQLFSKLLHIKNNDIKATDEEYQKVCEWLKFEIGKAKTLDKEIAKIKEYSSKVKR